MRLSELSTDKALDVMCEITPYLNSIAIDEDLMAELRREVDPQNAKTRADVMMEGAKRINNLVPIILKTHRADIYGILSVLNEKTPGEIAAQNFLKTGAQIRDVLKDKELLDFFKSCVGQERSA